MYYYCLIYLVIFGFGALAVGYKQNLRSNTNFDNAERWSGNRIPCAGNKIEFDPNQIVSIFVQTNATITEITFPLNGEFIFDDGVTWGSSEELSSCYDPDEAVYTYNSHPDNWYNFKNWETRDSNNNKLSSLDLLDIEKVPCEYDEIVFPTENSWTLHLSFNLTGSHLTIWDKPYGVDAFADYRLTASGRYQFQGPGTVTSLDGECTEPTGCLCRTSQNAKAIEAKICGYVQCADRCQEPLHPTGQCCGTCGALFTMTYSESYSEKNMSQRMIQLKSEKNYSNVHFALSKISSSSINYEKLNSGYQRSSADMIQILIRDDAIGVETGRFAKQFASELNTILQEEPGLGVSNVTLTNSAEGNPTSTGGLEGGVVAGIVIATIAAVALLVTAATLATRRYGSMNFNFSIKFKSDKTVDNPLFDMMENNNANCFENPSGKTEKTRSVSVTGIPDVNVFTSDFGVSFANPAYQEEDV